LTATRLHFEGQTLEQDGGGASREVYYVNQPRQSALQDTDLPNRGDSHPSEPGQIVDALTARAAPDGNSFVDVLYSNDGRFGAPEQSDPPIIEGQFSWSIRYQPISQPIPVLKRVKKTLPAFGNDPPVEKMVWTPHVVSVNEIRPLQVLTSNAAFSVSGIPTSLPQFAAIAAQTNKLHQIQGGLYGFSPQNVDQRTQGSAEPGDDPRWQIRYSWEQDTGSFLLPWGFVAASGIAAPTQGNYGSGPLWVGDDQIRVPFIEQGGEEYVRPPFTFVQTVPDPDDIENLPAIRFPLTYTPDFNGWQTLPGVV